MATKKTIRARKKAAAPPTEFELLRRSLGRPAAESIMRRRERLKSAREAASAAGISVREMKRRARGVSGGQMKPRLRKRVHARQLAHKVPAKGDAGYREGGSSKPW